MRYLTEEERIKVESKKDTVDKWDIFLKEACHNMGFKKDIAENMYPYHGTIPLSNGEDLPLEKKGRIFMKTSWADHLLIYTTLFNYRSKTAESLSELKNILLDLFSDLDPNKCSIRATDILRNATVNIYANGDGYNVKGLQQKITEENYPESFALWMPKKKTKCEPVDTAVSENDMRLRRFIQQSSDKKFNVYFPDLANIYDDFPIEDLIEIERSAFDFNKPENTLAFMYKQYITEKYLCISLNPIDKLMCSTKQPFGSCVSLAKENQNDGTSSVGGLGLPALFPNESVFTMFLTNGKHKNMYFEREEWDKDPKERDPQKAYKYFKMTTRNFLYSCKPHKQRLDEAQLSGSRDLYNDEDLEKDYVIVGRVYSQHSTSISNAFEIALTNILEYSGVQTIWGLEDKLHKPSFKSSNDYIRRALTAGILNNKDIVVVDRYGNIRGSWYDNATIMYNERVRHDMTRKERLEIESLVNHTMITSMEYRNSSGGTSTCHTDSGLNAFKLMTGQQNYTYLDRYTKICTACDDIIESGASVKQTADGIICESCATKLGYIYCADCDTWYTKEEAYLHKKTDIAKIIFNRRPTEYKEEVIMCLQKFIDLLKKSEPYVVTMQHRETPAWQHYYITTFCPHCGRFEKSAYRNRSDIMVIKRKINGKIYNIPLSLCSKCSSSAVVCDRCKKICVVDSYENAVVLLPRKRVICRDCLDKVKLKSDFRQQAKALLEEDGLAPEDVMMEETESGDNTLLQAMMQHLDKEGGKIPLAKTKDINKQLKARKEPLTVGSISGRIPIDEEQECTITSQHLLGTRAVDIRVEEALPF